MTDSAIFSWVLRQWWTYGDHQWYRVIWHKVERKDHIQTKLKRNYRGIDCNHSNCNWTYTSASGAITLTDGALKFYWQVVMTSVTLLGTASMVCVSVLWYYLHVKSHRKVASPEEGQACISVQDKESESLSSVTSSGTEDY